MNLIQSAGKLYSLDTLDSRFTSPKNLLSRVDPARPSSDDGRQKKNEPTPGSTQSRWRSPEFIFYGVIFLFAVPLMFKTVFDVSQRGSVGILHSKPVLISQTQHQILITPNSRVNSPKAGYRAEKQIIQMLNMQASETMYPTCYLLCYYIQCCAVFLTLFLRHHVAQWTRLEARARKPIAFQLR